MANFKWVKFSIVLLSFVSIFTNTAYSAGSSQQRSQYARQYKDYYDRIQVGATANAEGKTLHVYLKYNLDDFVVGVARQYLGEWKALGFTKVIVSDKSKSWSERLN